MTNGKATIRRLPTGVHGLDEVLGGGLPEYSFNIIAGAPGAGKTTLAHQMMFSLATPQRPALYFTVLGEPPLKMLRYQQQFDYFDSAKVNSSVRFFNLSEDMSGGDLSKVLARIVAEVETHGPGLVFVDSFRSVVLASQTENKAYLSLQQFIQQLGVLMTSWQATTFLVGEYFAESDPNPIFTVADGLIWLRQSVQRNSVVRKMEIMKMRGAPTLPGLHTFRITSAGIHIFAPAQLRDPAEAAAITPVSGRVSMGVPGLDEMMGGGLPCGYSLLVAGPSGSGKSILAGAFLCEGARRGETGIIAAFEQRPNKSRGSMVTELIKSGRIGVVDTRELNVSVDEMAMLLIAEIRRLKATRVRGPWRSCGKPRSSTPAATGPRPSCGPRRRCARIRRSPRPSSSSTSWRDVTVPPLRPLRLAIAPWRPDGSVQVCASSADEALLVADLDPMALHAFR